MAKVLPRRFQPSGINSHFVGNRDNFSDYIATMEKIIGEGRTDLVEIDSQTRETIIAANAPFELLPNDPTSKKGILLIHGMFESPNCMRELGTYLQSQGFLVRTLLLPGHGTRPGDLLTMKLEEWSAAVDYGIENLYTVVDEVYLGGFSLGGALSLHAALKGHHPLKGLVLLAPPLKINSNWIFLTDWHEVTSQFSERARWLYIQKDEDYSRYETFSINAIHQATRLTAQIAKLRQHRIVTIPTFIVATDVDEAVSTKATMAFFREIPTHKKMVIYSNDPEEKWFPKHPTPWELTVHPAAVPNKNIIDISHIGIPYSPDNPRYGERGHQTPPPFDNLWKKLYAWKKNRPKALGALTRASISQYDLKRLNYNPFFDEMTGELGMFLKEIS